MSASLHRNAMDEMMMLQTNVAAAHHHALRIADRRLDKINRYAGGTPYGSFHVKRDGLHFTPKKNLSTDWAHWERVHNRIFILPLLTNEHLRKCCSENGIDARKSWTKKQLIQALMKV
jgi:hypothetical protein